MPLLRPSLRTDVVAIASIYAHYVLHSTASFEIVPPDEEEVAKRREQVLERGLPFLVAEVDQTVIGYAYAVPYRPRAAYRYTVEDSVYVHHDHLGKGIGRHLLAALIEVCELTSCRQMVAVIGGKETAASIALHRALGFERVGFSRRLVSSSTPGWIRCSCSARSSRRCLSPKKRWHESPRDHSVCG